MIQPIGSNILVEPAPEELKSGALLLPETYQTHEKGQEGTVVAVGPGALNRHGQRVPLEVRPGDRVLIRRFLGTELLVGERRVVVCDGKRDVLFVIEDEAAA